jgi:16S rRNA (guanine527-N7)-methyltransferase
VKHLARDAAGFGVTLSDQQVDRLQAFLQLLRERAIPAGLVAASDRERLYPRHLLDCLRAAGLFEDSDRQACDLGSGAGLPGVVLAAALPRCRFLLVESKHRAAGFLEMAVERLQLDNVTLVVGRVDDVRLQADVATARAFAPPGRSWAAAHPLLRPGGRLFYFASASTGDLAARLTEPEPPAAVRTTPALETFSPLVIMSRRR